MSDAARIAEGLSENTQAVILEMTDGKIVYPVAQVAADAGVPVAETRKIMRQLRKDGLAAYGPLWSEDECQPRGSGTWLSSIGLAVRAHLLATDRKDER